MPSPSAGRKRKGAPNSTDRSSNISQLVAPLPNEQEDNTGDVKVIEIVSDGSDNEDDDSGDSKRRRLGRFVSTEVIKKINEQQRNGQHSDQTSGEDTTEVAVSATKKKRKRSNTSQDTVQLFASLFEDADATAEGSGRPRRTPKAVQKFDPRTYTPAPRCRVGEGFECPRCSSICSYDERSCSECRLGCYYEAGVGVVTLKERPVPASNTTTNQAVNSRAIEQQRRNNEQQQRRNNTNSDDDEEDTHVGNDGSVHGTNTQDNGTAQAHADTSDTQDEGEVEEEKKSKGKGPTKSKPSGLRIESVPVEGNIQLVGFPSLEQANIDNTTESRVIVYNNESFDNFHQDNVEVNTLAIVPYTGYREDTITAVATADNNITLNHLVWGEVDANGSGERSQIGMTYLSSSHSIMEVVLSLCGWTEGHRNRNDTITTVAATSNNSMYTTERAKCTIFKATAVLAFVLAFYSSIEFINTKPSLPRAVEGRIGTKSILSYNSMFDTSSVIDHTKGTAQDKEELDVQESLWPTSYVELEKLYTAAKAVIPTSSNEQSEMVKAKGIDAQAVVDSSSDATANLLDHMTAAKGKKSQVTRSKSIEAPDKKLWLQVIFSLQLVIVFIYLVLRSINNSHGARSRRNGIAANVVQRQQEARLATAKAKVAISIQRLCRGRARRSRARLLAAAKTNVALNIQRLSRGAAGRNRARLLAAKFKVAVSIQRLCRGRAGRNKARLLAAAKVMLAINIQRRFRARRSLAAARRETAQSHQIPRNIEETIDSITVEDAVKSDQKKTELEGMEDSSIYTWNTVSQSSVQSSVVLIEKQKKIDDRSMILEGEGYTRSKLEPSGTK